MNNYEEGGRAVAIIAARRLDRYTQTDAQVTSWLGGFVWGPHLAPRQTWNLVDTTLRWQAGRWLIEASSTEATPAPVPRSCTSMARTTRRRHSRACTT
jgi:hypothetical protein